MKDEMTLHFLLYILRGKGFTGALMFEEGKILFSDGSIKLAKHKNHSGGVILDMLSSRPLPPGTQVIELSEDQVKLWLKWEELLYGEEELFISPLPEVDRSSLKTILERSGLGYLLVQSASGGD
jgi:hypothetical protein